MSGRPVGGELVIESLLIGGHREDLTNVGLKVRKGPGVVEGCAGQEDSCVSRVSGVCTQIEGAGPCPQIPGILPIDKKHALVGRII